MLTTLTRAARHSLFVLFLLALFPTLAIPAFGQTTSTIQVIPRPRMITETTDRFLFSRDTRIVLANPRSVDNRFAADDFIADAREAMKLAAAKLGLHTKFVMRLEKAGHV